MTDNVIRMAPQSRVDEAWDELVGLRKLETDKPELRLNRGHVNACILAHERYRLLFLMQERGK